MPDDSSTAAMTDTMFFRCNACGKCCNTPPAMTIGELFHHRDLFVGCLAIGKVERLRAGSRIGSVNGLRILDADDAAETTALHTALLFDPDPQQRSPFIYRIATQGVAYAFMDRCPALSAQGLCTIHENRKPGICSVVPLDPLLPDRLQDSVLHHRNASADYLGAHCIAVGERDGYRPLIRMEKVIAAAYAENLAAYRAALVHEKQQWGNAVSSLLKRDLFDHPVQAQRIAEGGWLSLPLVPVLAVLAAKDTAAGQTCIQYLKHQLDLILRMIDEAIVRKHPADRATTAQLRAYALAYEKQRAAFLR